MSAASVALAMTVLPAAPAVAAGGPSEAGVAGTVPCPTIQVPRPARSAPPPVPAKDGAVGGSALATSGLVIPPGVPEPPRVTATSWLVADLGSGAVLGGCGPHAYGTPASVQKLLLVATLLTHLDPKRLVTVTRSDLDFEPGSSAVGLVLGGRYSVETLWLGLLLNSGNDAARTLARVGGGADGVAGTIRAMNAEARRLGAYQTHAVTPSGLDGRGQFTSAYDLALIARACFVSERFRRYAATRQASIPAQPPRYPRGFQIQNDNRLLFHYRGALGGKTGYTDLARHTFVGAAERGGRRLVVTLLGAESRPARGWRQGAALLDWGFALPAGASVGELVTPEAVAAAASPRPGTVPPIAVAPAAAPPARARWIGWAAAAAVVLVVPALLVAGVRRRPSDSGVDPVSRSFPTSG